VSVSQNRIVGLEAQEDTPHGAAPSVTNDKGMDSDYTVVASREGWRGPRVQAPALNPPERIISAATSSAPVAGPYRP